ncbi:MAG: ABC transporter permease [Bacteroidales bacterium]|nr:ABC transporter permease [Bacteroidales bacterium]
MNWQNLMQMALKSLRNNKFRCFLTMLGIIIGVSSVITMLAIGQGSKRSIQAQISEMGSNVIMVFPGNRRAGGVRLSASDMQTLKIKDYEDIRKEATLLRLVSPMANSSGQFIYGAKNTPSTLYGVNCEYPEIRRLEVEQGEMFTEDDLRSLAKVCVVGQTVVDNLFEPGEEVLGKTIRFNATPFKIIGVLKKKGYNSMGQDQDDLVLAPYTSVQKRILAVTYFRSLYASAVEEDESQAAIAEITAILRRNHQLQAGQENDFEVRSQEEISQMLSSTTNLLTVLLASIAGISLLVGGIGIMNIMYVSVTERTKEIGLRLSIGAKGNHILRQFLIESVFISISGGIIGVILGCLASLLVKKVAGWPVFVQPWSVLLAFAVCTVTGVFFGWYPAKKAANLDPIEALRYE